VGELWLCPKLLPSFHKEIKVSYTDPFKQRRTWKEGKREGREGKGERTEREKRGREKTASELVPSHTFSRKP
jgi:hypothetical protein